jgi:hypothetical protein
MPGHKPYQFESKMYHEGPKIYENVQVADLHQSTLTQFYGNFSS